jgi:hypothetical protein
MLLGAVFQMFNQSLRRDLSNSQSIRYVDIERLGKQLKVYIGQGDGQSRSNGFIAYRLAQNFSDAIRWIDTAF